MPSGIGAVRLYKNTVNSIPVGVFTDVTSSFEVGAASDSATITASDLLPGTRYWFWVQVEDLSGNVSGIVSLGNITTAAPSPLVMRIETAQPASWPGSGPTLFDTVGDHHVDLGSVITVVSDASTGLPVARFNGTGGRPIASDPVPLQGDFLLEIEFRPTDATRSVNDLFTIYPNATAPGRWQMAYSPDNQWMWLFFAGIPQQLHNSPAGSVQMNQWSTVGLRRTGDTVYFSVNGSEVLAIPLGSASYAFANAPQVLGGDAQGQVSRSLLNGDVAAVKVSVV